MSPPPAGLHQLASLGLATVLRTAAPADLLVVQAMGIRLAGPSVLIPDILVAARTALVANTSGVLDPTEVALVIEIVSPGSRTADRLVKPNLYAGAGLPAYWRVELGDGPAIVTYGLQPAGYVETGAARSGAPLTVTFPFPVTLDAAVLQP